MKIHIVALTALFAAASTYAQAPAAGAGEKSVPISKIERKRKAPVSADILRVKLPGAKEIHLDDGLKVLLLEDHKLPLITMELVIPGAGAMYDPPDTPGVANLTALMLKEGTASRDSKQIAEEIERLGATINANASYGSDSAYVRVSGLSDNVADWLKLTADIVINPSFPDSELAKLKLRQKAQLQQMRSQPNFLIRERFSKAVYGDHPASVTSASAASIDAITSDMLKKWHSAHWVPQNAVLGVAGDITGPQLIALLGNLPAWNPNDTKVAPMPPSKPVAARKIYLVDRPGSVQTEVYIGNIAVSRTDPDFIPLTVMDRVVGGGPASRLFINLREEKGYTYGAYSFLDARKWAGPWIALASMRTDATEGAMTEFMHEIRRIRDQAVPESELEENKRSLVANFALSLESPSELLDYAMEQKLYGLAPDYWDTYPAKIAQVTAEQVQRVARKYIDPETLQIVAVGDVSKLKPVFEKLGQVEVYDAQGKRM